MELELFVEDPGLHDGTPVSRDFPILDYHTYRSRNRRARYDLNVYQMGNDIVHRFIYLTMIDNPGLVVLHEPMLHHFMLQMLSSGWTRDDYSRELDYNYGAVREDIESIVATDPTELARFRYPMIQRVVDSALGIIVHSEYARSEVMRHDPAGPVCRVNPAYVPDPVASRTDTKEARRRLGLDEDLFLVGTFGFVTPAKRIEPTLDALRALLPEEPRARLLVVGGEIPEYSLDEKVKERGLEDYVIRPGFVGWADLMLYMVSCDLAVSFRYPSAGETPSGVIHLLGLGRPTVVTSHMAFAEFPDDVCLKVEPGSEGEQLLAHLRRARGDRGALEAMGRRAGEYVAANYRAEDTARAYDDFSRSVVSGGFRYGSAEPVPAGTGHSRDALIEDVAEALVSMGVGACFSDVVKEISDSVDAVLPQEPGERADP